MKEIQPPLIKALQAAGIIVMAEATKEKFDAIDTEFLKKHFESLWKGFRRSEKSRH